MVQLFHSSFELNPYKQLYETRHRTTKRKIYRKKKKVKEREVYICARVCVCSTNYPLESTRASAVVVAFSTPFAYSVSEYLMALLHS